MKNKKYVKVAYKKETDEFQVLISVDDGETWGLDTAYRCRLANVQKEGESPEYIHFSIINQLKHCVDLGYEFLP